MCFLYHQGKIPIFTPIALVKEPVHIAVRFVEKFQPQPVQRTPHHQPPGIVHPHGETLALRQHIHLQPVEHIERKIALLPAAQVLLRRPLRSPKVLIVDQLHHLRARQPLEERVQHHTARGRHAQGATRYTGRLPQDRVDHVPEPILFAHHHTGAARRQRAHFERERRIAGKLCPQAAPLFGPIGRLEQQYPVDRVPAVVKLSLPEHIRPGRAEREQVRDRVGLQPAEKVKLAQLVILLQQRQRALELELPGGRDGAPEGGQQRHELGEAYWNDKQ
uniref:Uncharacterized protein n=1 Tax=Anopheles melas TaxID=34690 RepID=A0A182TWM5_9DIPT